MVLVFSFHLLQDRFFVWLLPFVIISLGPRALRTVGKPDSQSLILDLRDILKVKLMYWRISKAIWKDHSPFLGQSY